MVRCFCSEITVSVNLFSKTPRVLQGISNDATDVVVLVVGGDVMELKQPLRRRQQKPHKFAYLTMKNRIFARFARAFLTF